MLPWQGLALSIGVGSGRFASLLGVQIGIDPAEEVLKYTGKRGVTVLQGIAEALPFSYNSFQLFSQKTPRSIGNIDHLSVHHERIAA